MPAEHIEVPLEGAALVAAREAARRDGVSLPEWLAEAAWTQAVAQAARSTAEEDRRWPDELPGWREDALDRIFDQDAA
ncbi:hypothetical protein [Symbioplanes lichenis]|uniref:hypothetical protein n=1 Tax=Symbioplanes lichenis TaxID=1629072 RepID=UPI002739E405|nr:hypothetical protein [Actinoplanes lichenis]